MNTEKRDNQQDIILSKICCQRLKEIQDVSYANAYTLFHLRHYKAVQQSIRNISPKIKEAGDWVRLRFEGMAVALSISDDAIKAYGPLIYEFQCFASAVRLLGIYEDYIKNIVDIAEDRIPDEMTQFRNSHQIRIREKKRFWTEQSGRGVDFLQRVFGWNPLPSYRPGLQLMFHLRNLTVHNNGIADDKLCQLSMNEHIERIGEVKVGSKVSWNFGTYLQLQHLVIDILKGADPYIVDKLKLPTLKQRPFWHVDNALS